MLHGLSWGARRQDGRLGERSAHMGDVCERERASRPGADSACDHQRDAKDVHDLLVICLFHNRSVMAVIVLNKVAWIYTSDRHAQYCNDVRIHSTQRADMRST